jgi:putative ABC transport system substrate-binding protein
MQRLSRRRFVVGAGLAGAGLLAGCGRLPGQAEQPAAKVARIGVMTGGAPQEGYQAFRLALQELGYVEGQNLHIESRSADGREETAPILAGELVRLPVDIIVTGGDVFARSARQASESIPIVMASSPDPVSAGLVDSLARPGGNTTGLSLFTQELSGKRLELLRTALPTLTRVAFLGSRASIPQQYRATEDAAGLLGVRVQFLEANAPDELERAFAAAVQEQIEALIVPASPVTIASLPLIANLAVAHGLPTIGDRRSFAQAGGLMVYGPSIPASWHRAAYFVDRILKGTKPADLPIEQPMRFEFVVNMKTARELGITFPHEVALQITEVIE